MATTYRITTFGIAAGRPQGPARAVLAGLLHGEAEAIDALAQRVLSGERVTLAEHLEETAAGRLHAALTGVGIDAKLYPESLDLLPVELETHTDIYRCPACQHVQDYDAAAPDTCQACGVIGSKYEEVREIKDVLDAERRRLQARISEAEAAGIEAKRQHELQQLREIGRRRAERELGITRLTKLRALVRSPGFAPLAGGVAVAVVAVVGVWQYRLHQPPAAAPVSGKTAIIISPPAGAVVRIERPQTGGDATAAVTAGTAGPAGQIAATGTPAVPGAPAAPGVPGRVADAASRADGVAAVAGPEIPGAERQGEAVAMLQGLPETSPERLSAGLLDAGRLARLPPVATLSATARPLPPHPDALLELARYERLRGEWAAAARALGAADALAQGPQGTAALADAIGLERIALELGRAAAGNTAPPADEAAAGALRQQAGAARAEARRLANALFADAARAEAWALLARSAPTPERAAADFDQARDYVRLTEPASARVAAQGRLARELLLAGRPEAGVQEFVLAQTLADGLADRQERIAGLALLARLRAEAGDVAGAESVRARLGDVSPVAPERAQWLAARAAARVAAGEPAAARTDIAAAFDGYAALGDVPSSGAGYMYLARVLQRAGDEAGAARLVEGALACYAQDSASIATVRVVPAPLPAPSPASAAPPTASPAGQH